MLSRILIVEAAPTSQVVIGVRFKVNEHWWSPGETLSLLVRSLEATRVNAPIPARIAPQAQITWTRSMARTYQLRIVNQRHDVVLDTQPSLDPDHWVSIRGLTQEGCFLGVMDDDFNLDNYRGLIFIPRQQITWTG